MRPIDAVRKVCPHARPSYLAAIENGDGLFLAAGIITPKRLAQFLAQGAAETGGFTIDWESGNYTAQRIVEVFGPGKHSASIGFAEAQMLAHNGQALFERTYGLGNPKKASELGNTQPGDGWRYRGGGIMQTTGRANYRRMGQKCGVDFEGAPELVLSAEHALKPALTEWTEGHLNDYADKGDVLSISRKINIGNTSTDKIPNGYSDRKAWLAKFEAVITSVELKSAPAATHVETPAPPLTPKPAPAPAPQLPPVAEPPPPKPEPKTLPDVNHRNTGIGALVLALIAGAAAFAKEHPAAIGITVIAAAASVYFLIKHFRSKP